MFFTPNDYHIGDEINGTILLGGGEEIEEKEVVLQVGDLVSLHVPRLDGYVGAEGILDSNVTLSCPAQRFDHCVFQVTQSKQIALK